MHNEADVVVKYETLWDLKSSAGQAKVSFYSLLELKQWVDQSVK